MTAQRLSEPLCLSAVGKRDTLLRSICSDHSICLDPLSHRQPFTSHHMLLYTLLELLSDVEKRKGLTTSQSADDASISENDPALIPIATGSSYAMTRTLGRTGGAVYRGGEGNSVQITSVGRSRNYQPALVTSVLLGSENKSNQSLKNFCHGPNAYNFPRILHRNASPTCYVKYGRLILAVLQQENDPSHSQKKLIGLKVFRRRFTAI
ncbi:hypothetical protein BGY98DRAFT_936831 [Russula aff. rugulosa BPL654]|nr:hypothetical protein BGY98DRAFT_936831 [Russula aff. rugulosa BPL654]